MTPKGHFKINLPLLNQEEFGDVLLEIEVKEEPKDNFEESRFEDMIKQDECVEGPELEPFCDPINQEDCDEALFEVKEDLDEGTEGAEGPQYETFCDPNKGQLISKCPFGVFKFL